MQYRSKLEQNVSKALNLLHIKHTYEPHKLYLHTHHTNYIPDFYLPNHNIYIEPKGRKTKNDRQQVETTAKLHNEIIMMENDKATYYTKTDNTVAQSQQINLVKCSQCGRFSFVPHLYSWHCRVCMHHNGDKDIVTYDVFDQDADLYDPTSFIKNIYKPCDTVTAQ